MAIRFLIDGDSNSDNTSPFVLFLDDQRAPVGRNTSRFLYTIVNPNCYLADKFWHIFNDIGAGFHTRKWCCQYEVKNVAFPNKNLFVHATAQYLCIGPQLTRYHQAKDLVGDCYWFIPSHQLVMSGETVVLQTHSVIAHLQHVFVPDPNYERYPQTCPGSYVVIWSMMDTATICNGEWLIRLLKTAEVEAIKQMAIALANVVSPVVILLPNFIKMGFIGEGARRWDFNID